MELDPITVGSIAGSWMGPNRSSPPFPLAEPMMLDAGLDRYLVTRSSVWPDLTPTATGSSPTSSSSCSPARTYFP